MKKLGSITNRTFDGDSVVLVDSRAKFGGWDVFGDAIADADMLQLDLDGVHAYVDSILTIDGDSIGTCDVHQCDNGRIWLVLEEEELSKEQLEQLESESPSEMDKMGVVDVPSGTLVIAISYPALNMVTHGNMEGVAHDAGERLDIKVDATSFVVMRFQGRYLLRPEQDRAT
ncbi:MAG: hypothetical protein JRH20_32050 [Deltaproteobacteria bacterium]|nr:hypothetical protein [Deltaproteobacteria bacterium]